MTDDVRLSESELWHRQVEFYCREGVGAWQGKIPFYATSNAFIANAYAQVIVAYMQDVLERFPPATPLVFPIVELGAGPGIFAFHVVQRLSELLTQLGNERLSFVYVLTDVAERNIDFWSHHPAWEQHIEGGRVDFAHLDLLTNRDPTLEIVGAAFSSHFAKEGPRAPLIALANYVFDSIPTDVFRIEDGVLFEGRVPPSPSFEANYPANHAVALEDINSPVRYRAAALPYYQDAPKDAVLQRYVDTLAAGYFCLPIAALKAIDALGELAGGELLLLSSDKGYANHLELYAEYEPELAFHNEAHSIMVNFHAIGEYCRQQGGDCHHQSTQQGLATSAFTLGAQLQALPRTRFALDAHLRGVSPGDLFRMSVHLAETPPHGSLETLVAYLNVMRWDPDLFNQHFEFIMSEVGETDASVWKDLAEGIRRAAAQVYHVPHTTDTLATLGVILQEMELFADAVQCFEASLRQAGESALACYHLGLCYLGLEEYALAVEHLERAVALDADDVTAKGWLVQAREWRDEASSAS